MAFSSDQTAAEKVLHDRDLIKYRNYKNWALSCNVKIEKNIEQIEKQNQLQTAGIKATPTVLINGYCLRSVYKLHDIKYFVAII